ncbi:MAG: biotin transporter BioY, partial [Lachnospiraceae bacterium]|nr:biotin transporter BioY [Lachnospiraceae bacterium]
MKQFFSVKSLTVMALMAAICCVLGPFTVPIGPVPVSFVMIGIYLSVYALGMGRGTIAVAVYLLIGLCGLPVFSGFSGGPAKLFGPTGGYLIGYLFLALISGWFIDRFSIRKWYLHLIGMVLGMAICYTFGTAWFMILMKMGLAESLTLCVFPFIPFDLIKILLCYGLGSAVRTGLARAG